MRTSTRQSTPRRGARRPAHAAARSPERRTAEQRIRDEGGPQDTALYRCACGCRFEGVVSTDVVCPGCGATQAW